MGNLQTNEKQMETFFEKPAAYMLPHKNPDENSDDPKPVKKKRFKPKAMIGSVRKPNLDFSQDLSYLTHQTEIVRKKMRESQVQKSKGLNQKREAARQAHKLNRKKQAILKD